MAAALALAGNLTGSSILAMHRALMIESDPSSAGRWRTEQVWIGGGNLGPHRALFVPPHDSRIAEAIADLLDFVARDDLSLLVHAALAHAQFETIHPFTDGNGRTGRALVHAMLFANAAFRAVTNGRELVNRLRETHHRWQALIKARSDSAVWRLADLLLRRPVVNARVVAEELDLDVGNVHRYIKPLLEIGILAESHVKRNQVWRAPEVLAALDAFAARAGRRAPSAAR